MSDLDDFAHNAELRTQLREPFPAHLITKLDKGFGKIDTLNHAVVTDRLNKVAPGWTTSEPQIITVQGVDGLPHVVAVVASMTIGGTVRWEVGEVERPSTYGDELKKAMSDFIKRAAMRFGVGIDLWSKEDLTKTSPTSAPSLANQSATQGAAPDRDTTSGEVSPPDTGAAPLPLVAEAVDERSTHVPLPIEAEEKLASDAQWERLLKVCDNSMTRAVNKINKANQTQYTAATARAGATWQELVAALV